MLLHGTNFGSIHGLLPGLHRQQPAAASTAAYPAQDCRQVHEHLRARILVDGLLEPAKLDKEYDNALYDCCGIGQLTWVVKQAF